MLNIIKNILCIKTAEQFYDKKTLQQKRFKKMLKHVYHNSKFYRDLYSSHGIHEKDLEDVKITDLPFINKSIIMENFDNILTVKDLSKDLIENYLCSLTEPQYGKLYLDKYMLIHTSGSTGTVGYFVYGQKDWEMLLAQTISRVVRVKPKLSGKKYKTAFIGAIGGNFAGCSLVRSAPSVLYDYTLISVHKPPEEIIQELNRLQPEIITSYGSVMQMLAEAQIQGKLNIHPIHLHSAGDAITQTAYELTKEAWGLYPSNFYACTESLCMGVQRTPGEDLELFDDFNIFEILDENQKEVGLDSEGNLVLTNLYNYTQPLIRYQVNDVLKKSTEERSERGFLRIRSLNGRKGILLEYKNNEGEKVKINYSMLLSFISPGVQRYQFAQTQPDELVMRVKMRSADDQLIKEAKARMDQIITKHNLQGCVKTKIEVVDEFKNNPKTGKFELIRPYTPEMDKLAA